MVLEDTVFCPEEFLPYITEKEKSVKKHLPSSSSICAN
jgi:hypothetical protein